MPQMFPMMWWLLALLPFLLIFVNLMTMHFNNMTKNNSKKIFTSKTNKNLSLKWLW